MLFRIFATVLFFWWDTCNKCVFQACQSLDPKQRFLCNDHEGRISYLSTQQATQHDVAALVRQACIRSLSCEVRIKQCHCFHCVMVKGVECDFWF